MLRKLFFFICLSTPFSLVVADQSNTPPTPSNTAATLPKNNPAVGSRQAGSEQIFGDPKVSQHKPQNIPKQQNGMEPNNPAVGGRQSGSEQIFGQSATPPSTPQKYTKPDINRGNSNSPTVGGRQAGSEQLFGQSAAPINNMPAK